MSCGFVFGCVSFSVGFHCFTPLPRRKGAACSRFVVRCVACRARVCWVCFRYVMCKRNARQTPEGPPVRCHTGLPIQFLYSLRFDALSIAFRVAGFGRADLTALPQIIQPRCDSLRSVSLDLVVLGNSLAHFLPCQSQQIGHLLCLRLCSPLGLKPI